MVLMIILGILAVSLITAIITVVESDLTAVVTVNGRGRRIHHGSKRYKWVSYKVTHKNSWVRPLLGGTFAFIALAPLAMLAGSVCAELFNSNAGGFAMAGLNIPLAMKVLGFRGTRGIDDNRQYLPKTHVSYFVKNDEGGMNLRAHPQNADMLTDQGKEHELVSKIERPVGSIGDMFGMRYGVISVGFNIKQLYTATEVASIVGLDESILFSSERFADNGEAEPSYEGSKYITMDPRAINNGKCYRVRAPKTWMGTPTMVSLCGKVLKELEIAEDRLISPHPKWPVAGKKSEIYLVYTLYYKNAAGKTIQNNWRYMMQMIGVGTKHEEMMKIFIRAGKEIHSTPIGKKRLIKIKIVEPQVAEDGSVGDDGDFHLRGGLGQPSGEVLVRAIPVADVQDTSRSMLEDAVGKKVEKGLDTARGFFVLKGRGVTCTDGELRSLDGNTIYPKDCGFDSLVTLDNMKWLPKNHGYKPGDIVECIAIFSKNEDAKKKDKYKFNLLSKYLGLWTETSMSMINKMFRNVFARIAKILENPDKNILANLDKVVGDDDESLSLGEKMAKYFCGLSTWMERIEIVTKTYLRGKSVDVEASDYPSILFKTEWCGKKIGKGEFLASEEFIKESLEKHNVVDKFITVCRYPFVSYQSFMNMKHIGTADYMPGRMLILNPADAKAIQADGDDHASTLFKLRSLFTTTKKYTAIIARNVIDRGYNFSQLELYFKGAIAQSGIGTTFNLMLMSLVGIMDRTRLASKDALHITKGEADKLLDRVYTEFGGALDMFAQGIKKNIQMPNLWELRELAIELIGYDPEKVTDDDVINLGEGMKAAIVYMAKRSPKVLAPIIKELWGADVRFGLPKRGVKNFRKLEGASPVIRKALEKHIMKAWISIEDRKKIKNFKKLKVNSGPIWHMELLKIVEGWAGARLFEIEAMINGGAIARKAGIEKLTRFLDAYAFTAYKMNKIIEEFSNKTEYKNEEHAKMFLKDGLMERMKVMNGLYILAANMADDKFIVPTDSDRFDDKADDADIEGEHEETGPIDVWYFKGNKWSKLSNLAERKFANKGHKYVSVEHAYQTNKSGRVDVTTYKAYVSAGQKIKGKVAAKTTDNFNIKLMKKIIKVSMLQNPGIIKLLLSSGDRVITHNNDKSIWRTEFPRILMELREEFRNNPPEDKKDKEPETPKSPETPKVPEAPNKEDKVKATTKKGVIYIDGSYTTSNEGVVGWGFITKGGKSQAGQLTSEDAIGMRQVSGEICASVKAIQFAIESKLDEVEIHYDYEGVQKWAEGTWKANKDLTKLYAQRIKELSSKIKITFVKTDAASNPADEVARSQTGANYGH